MLHPVKLTLLFTVAFAAIPGYGYGQKSSTPRPIVVELFTSQGCSSCPPADKLLTKLAQRNDVLALSFHVDYWDHIGWKDPFSNPDFTKRQSHYKTSFGLQSNYTPQVVIDGRFETIGNKRSPIELFIKKAAAHAEHVTLNVDTIGNNFLIQITEPKPAGSLSDIWLIGYDTEHITPVKRGENHGRTLTNTNVVRYLEKAGQWGNKPFSERINVSWEIAPEFYAVIVQEHNHGMVQAAMTAEFSPPKKRLNTDE